MEALKAYEAFRVQPVIQQLVGSHRVESLCCWGTELLVGLHEGSIVQYSTQDNGATWQAGRPHRFMDQKAVLQMATVKLSTRTLLLVLTEEGVRLHSLPEMLLKCQPMSSRGASLFAWSDEGQLLAVAVRRKVILYHLRGSDLQEAGERQVGDVVQALAWVARGQLALATRKQYFMLNVTTGTTADIASTGAAPVPLVQLCPGGQHFLLARDNVTYFHDAADGRLSRRRPLQWSEPLQALTASGHYAVALTPGGLEVRSLRRAAESHVVQRVALAEPPRPLAPALAEDGAVFVAVGAAASSGSSNGGAVGGAGPSAAASSGSSSVYRLSPVPLEEQAHTLAELGEYSEALALAALVEEEEVGEHGPGASSARAAEGQPQGGGGRSADDAASPGAGVGADAAASGGARGGGQRASPDSRGEGGGAGGSRTGVGGGSGTTRRALLEERLRLAYGHHQFQKGEFDEGMNELAQCRSATALVLLRLLPSLVPAKFAHLLPTHAAGQPLPEVQEPTGDAFVTAVEQLLPYMQSRRTRAIQALADEEAAQQPAAPSKGDTLDGGSIPQGQQPSSDSSHVLASLSVAPEAEEPAAGAGAGPRPVPSRDTAPPGEPAPLSPRALLRVLDTAIVRMLVVVPDTGALLRFVQLNNYVDLEEGEKALSESGMYAELAALYKYNERHEEGMELLRRLSQEPQSLPQKPRGAAADLPGLTGVWAAARYLTSLSADQAPIIQCHAGWILAADPEAGLSALLHMREPLHPSLALSILNQHSRHYCSQYLETALETGVALPQDYHNELLLIYLREILAKEPRPEPSASGSQAEEGIKELLLPQRTPDADTGTQQVLFPEEVSQMLRQLQKGAGGGAGEGRGKGFASAPPSTGVSRVASQVDMQGGPAQGQEQGQGQGQRHGQGQGQGQRVPRAASAGAAAGRQSGRDSATPVVDREEDASGTESESETETAAGKPPLPKAGVGAGAAAVAAAATAHRRQTRRPRRSSTGDAAERSKPPLASGADLSPTRAGAMAPTAKATDAGAAAAAAAKLAAAEAAAAAAKAAAAGPPLIQRLRDLVYTSPYIDPKYVLDKLPPGELLEIRALMLERLGCHREALRLYVHALRDLPAAEAYCDRVYAAATGGGSRSGGGGGAGAVAVAQPPSLRLPGDLERPGDIYLELVQALYDGPESCPSAAAVAAAGGHGSLLAGVAGADGDALPSVWQAGRDSAGDARLSSATWQALSRLLSRKRERLDPMQVLKLLPDCVSLADVLPWLEGALRYRMEERRNLAVLRQLRRSENLVALEEAVRVRKEAIFITAERACSLCHKRISTMAFVSYPGGLLAHYYCHKAHTGQGAAGRDGGAEGAGSTWTGGGGAVVGPQLGTGRGARDPATGWGEVPARV